MILGKRLINTGVEAACTTDTADVFGDSSGVALYTLDFDASDSSSNGYDGTPTNVEFGVGGQINYGARFNGSSSYISSSNILDTSSAFSYSVWIKPQTIGLYDYLVGHQQAGSPYAGVGLIGTASNTFSIALAGSAPQVMTPSLTLDSWSHIVLTHDGSGNYTCYTNNNGSPITYSGATSNDASNPFRIGFSSVSGWGYFDGDIDQVRVFNKELNSTEVSTLYAETACVYTCTTDTVDYPTTNVAYYKLDNNATDETGSYDGTENNISYTFGRFGQAAVFNGSSSINAGTDVLTSLTAYTVSGWVNPTGSGNRTIVANYGYNGSTESGWIFAVGVGNVVRVWNAKSGTSYIKDSIGTVTNNQWSHVAVTTTQSELKIYINGSLDATHSITGFDHSGSVTDYLSIGVYQFQVASYYGSYYTGQIDQLRIFSSALDSTQVTQLYEEKPCADTSTFKTVLYTGNGGTQYISNVGFEPDLVWIKDRDTSNHHTLFDSIRGYNSALYPNLTNAFGTGEGFGSFDTNGFTLATGYTRQNASGVDYVAWCLKAGGDAVSNTNGSITSQVSANQDAGFSIVKFAGGNSSGTTVGHGLSSAPELIIVKNASLSTSWPVLTQTGYTIGATTFTLSDSSNYLALNSTTGYISYTFDNQLGGTVGGGSSSDDIIAYCFHSVSGVSKVGSYTGAGYPSTVTELTGFSPRWVMIKRTDATSSVGWWIWDSARDNVGLNEKYLVANSNAIEGTAASGITFLSNGFEIDTTATDLNASGGTYIYLAFA